MARPIFRDEIIAAVGGDLQPQYKITDGQTVIAERAKLQLVNPVAIPGTPQNASNMNNLFCFDNLAGVENAKYATSGLGTDAVTETVTDRTTNKIIAVRVSQRKSAGNWLITERLYDGDTLIQTRQVEYTKNGNEWGAVI